MQDLTHRRGRQTTHQQAQQARNTHGISKASAREQAHRKGRQTTHQQAQQARSKQSINKRSSNKHQQKPRAHARHINKNGMSKQSINKRSRHARRCTSTRRTELQASLATSTTTTTTTTTPVTTTTRGVCGLVGKCYLEWSRAGGLRVYTLFRRWCKKTNGNLTF